MGLGQAGPVHFLRERVLMRPVTPLNRNFLRGSALLTGLAAGFGMLGRHPAAIVAAALACLLALTAVRNLNRRNGDR